MKTHFYTILFLLAATLNVNAQWQKTNGPYGGVVRSLLTKGTDVFAGTAFGIFLSHDNGTNWIELNPDWNNTVVMVLAANDTYIFASTYTGPYLSEKFTLFRSPDNGATWDSVHTGLPNQLVTGIVAVNDTVYASFNGNGVYRSIDNGDHWTTIYLGLTDLNIYSLVASQGDIYAGGSGGVYRLKNKSSNWSHPAFPGTAVVKLGVNGSTIFAADNGDFWSPSRVYRTVNNGTNWDPADVGLFNPDVTAFAFNGSTSFIATSEGVYLSTNNGTNWNPVNNGLEGNVFDLAVSGANIFAGTGLGAFISGNNGAKWNSINNGLAGADVYAIGANQNTIFAGTQSGDILMSNDGGANWIASDSLGLGIKTIYGDGTNVYVGTSQGGKLYKSTNNGQSWELANTGITSTTVVSIIKNGTTLVAATWAGIFLSDDDGQNWTPAGLQTYSLKSVAAKGGLFFAGSIFDGVFVSKDSCANWTNSIGLGGGDALAFCGNTIFCAASFSSVFYSSDSGTTSSAVDLNNSYPEFNSFAVEAEKMFVGTDIGVFFSADSGRNWLMVNEGLRSLFVHSLQISGTDIYAATANGVWKRAINNITTSVNESMADPAFIIYPNPATDIFTVRVNQQLNGVIEIYNTLGEKVYKDAFNSQLKTLNAEQFPAGMYFVTLRNGEGIKSVKFLKQ